MGAVCLSHWFGDIWHLKHGLHAEGKFQCTSLKMCWSAAFTWETTVRFSEDWKWNRDFGTCDTSGSSVLTFWWCGLRVLILDLCIILDLVAESCYDLWRTMSNVAKSSEPKGYIWDGHSGFVYAAYHTWIQQLLVLLFQIVFYCGDSGQWEDKEQAKLKVAMMFRGFIWDSACGTGCLFNLERMWIMWAKMPEH